MRSLNLIPAAAGLLLAFAAGAPAAPISSEGGAHGSDWMALASYPPWRQFWGHRHGHRSHGVDLHALLRQHGPEGRGPWGIGDGPEEDLISAWLCGSASGGGTQDLAEVPPLQNDDETDPGDGDGSPTMIASDLDANPPQPMVPAVPEPGSLALLGAGALGLLAAHALLKKS